VLYSQPQLQKFLSSSKFSWSTPECLLQ
jgi:hypothetical protein